MPMDACPSPTQKRQTPDKATTCPGNRVQYIGKWCAAGLRNWSLAVELSRAMLEMHRRLVDVGRETIRRHAA